jgi:hypothetical protein
MASTSTTFESRLNAAIEEKGYRISPRMGLEDRLARYIELTWIDRGEPLTKDEVDAVVALTMVNNFGDESQPRRSSRLASRETWRPVEDATDGDDCCEETWQPRRSARLANRETVNYAEDPVETWQSPRRSTRLANRTVTPSESLRVSFATGSHPMVRRSQVTRR